MIFDTESAIVSLFYINILRGRSSLLSGFDMSKVPGHLKCSLSGRILEDAVILPCCRKIVSDSAARMALLGANLQCPLCKRSGISLDEVYLNIQEYSLIVNRYYYTVMYLNLSLFFFFLF